MNRSFVVCSFRFVRVSVEPWKIAVELAMAVLFLIGRPQTTGTKA